MYNVCTVIRNGETVCNRILGYLSLSSSPSLLLAYRRMRSGSELCSLLYFSNYETFPLMLTSQIFCNKSKEFVLLLLHYMYRYHDARGKIKYLSSL